MTYPYSVKSAGLDSSINIKVAPTITDNLNGSVDIIVSTSGMTKTPTGYDVEYVALDSNNSPTGSTQNASSTSNIINISGLTGGKNYRFRITASEEMVGNTVQVIKYISKPQVVASDEKFNLTNGATKGLLTITATESDFKNKKWAIAYKKFDTVLNAEAGNTESHYVFGTTLYMDSNIENPNQGAALGFFLSNSGQKGYYLLLETTSLAASANKKELRIVKAVGGGSLKSIRDTQRTIAESLNGIYGGREYIVNAKVKFKRVNNKKTVTITAYVNGFKIVAIDEDYDDDESPNFAIEPTNMIGLVSRSGKVSFDYAYASSVTKDQYTTFIKKDTIRSGIFDNDLLQIAFGDIVYDSDSVNDYETIKSAAIDEFGTTAREIYSAKLKFEPRPAFPLTLSTGLNESATILGTKMGNFDAEVFVLNNSSSMVPIDGSNLYIYGNTISPSSPLEYTTDETSDFVYKEPVIFETKWLQNYEDVKSLAHWIKDNTVNKGRIVNLSVFGNPILSVGDIVSIKYQFADMSGDISKERFIVTGISHSYSEGGLTTNVTCRKIHFSQS